MSQINETAIRTPGVYTTEIPLLAPSVAQVQTAVPAFVGYTEIAERKGESLKFRPTKISSLVEFRQWFGGPFNPKAGDFELIVNPLNFAITKMDQKRTYYLFDALRLFFDNGGGTCYIVSVGSYTDNVDIGDETTTPPTGLRGGLKAVETFDEPTLLLFPDAVRLTEDKLINLHFGVIEISFDKVAAINFRVLNNGKIRDGGARYIIHFRNRSSYWKYIFTTPTKAKEKTGTVKFKPAGKATATQSVTPIALTIKGVKTILKNDTTEPLPSADASVLRADPEPPTSKSKIVSEIRVTD